MHLTQRLIAALLLLFTLPTESSEYYRVNPGDVLSLHVRNEESLSLQEALVRPDGYISIPIIGEIQAGGKTIPSISQAISEKLSSFLKDEPVVTVTLFNAAGNAIYVLGKVNRPGQFTIRSATDITQALALAGGFTTFADTNSIKVLRRDKEGKQEAIAFDYSAIKKGKKLDGNIVLKSGDVVLVP